MKALYVQMMDLYLIFRCGKGCCHGNQIILIERVMNTTSILCTSIENELEYHYLYVRFNSSNDQATSNTRVMGLSCGVICVILRLAILIQYWSVTDTHTHTQTHDDGIYRA